MMDATLPKVIPQLKIVTQWRKKMHDANHTFDAFISYSHAADGTLAPSLQLALEKIARPWYRLRSLRIFRDVTNLSANPNLWYSIETNLAKCRWFVLLASVEAANSKWVKKEVDWWLTKRSADTLLIVVTGGDIAWSDAIRAFDADRSTALPPQLHGAFNDEPFFVDLRWARSSSDILQRSFQFRSAALDIVATLRGLSKDEIDGEAVRALRRNWYWAGTAVAALTGATIWALVSRDSAVTNAVRASLELDARRVVSLSQTKDQAHALPLAIVTAATAHEHLSETPSAVRSALRYGVEASREVRRWKTGGQVMRIVFEQDGRHLITVMRNNEVLRWTIDGERTNFNFKTKETLALDGEQFAIGLTSSASAIITRLVNGKSRVWTLEGESLAHGRNLDAQVIEVAEKSGNVYTVDKKGRIRIYGAKRTTQIVLPFRISDEVRTLHVDQDERKLIIVYQNGAIDMLKLKGNEITQLPTLCPEATALVEGGRRLMSLGCGKMESITLENIERTVKEHGSLVLIKELAVAPTGEFAVAYSGNDKVDWFSGKGAPSMESMLGAEDVRIAVSRDGTTLAMAGYLDGSVRLLDLSQRSVRTLSKEGSDINISALDVCDDRPELYWGTQGGKIVQVNYEGLNDGPRTWIPEGDFVESLKCFPKAGVISLDRGGKLRYWKSAEERAQTLLSGATASGNSVAVARSSQTVFLPMGSEIRRWKVGSTVEPLEAMPNPLAHAAWWRAVIGKGDTMLVLGSSDGDVAALDARNGNVLFPRRKLLWSNVWALSTDTADRGFIAGGAGTEVAVLDWSMAPFGSYRTDRFTFATSAAFDSTNNMIAVPTMTGEVNVLDSSGNHVGPAIRNVGNNQFVHVQFSRDGYLFAGGLSHSVSMHDFSVTRLLKLACSLLAARKISDDPQYVRLDQAAREKCQTMEPKSGTERESIVGQQKHRQGGWR